MKATRKGSLKAAQVRNVPNYPVVQLTPCDASEGAEWVFNPLRLTSGLLISMEAVVSYTPVIIQRMSIETIRVGFEVRGYSPSTCYKLRLRYYRGDDLSVEQFTLPMTNEMHGNRFIFDLPPSEIGEWLICALIIQLKTPMRGRERDIAIASGQEEPYEPVLIRGAWLEINGVS